MHKLKVDKNEMLQDIYQTVYTCLNRLTRRYFSFFKHTLIDHSSKLFCSINRDTHCVYL